MRSLRASIVLGLSVVYFSYVFQFVDRTPLTSGLGDWIDPYFINYLLEHWYHSILSVSDPASPAMFFPARGTLGYSHGLILFVPFYLAVRPFFHPFQAYTISLFLVIETGCLFLYAGLRRFFRLGFVEALLLTAFFVSSQNVVHAGTGTWSQRASVFLVPVILFVALATRQMSGGPARLTLAWLSGLLPALLFVQDFYTGQFVLLISILLLTGALFLMPFRATLGPWWSRIRADWREPVIPTRAFTPPSRWWLGASCLCLAAAAAIWIHPIQRVRIAGVRVSADGPGRALLLAALMSGWFVVRRWHLVARVVRTRRDAWRRVSALPAWRQYKHDLLAGALGAVMGGVLFLWIYLGSYREHPSFPEEMLARSLTAFDVANAGLRAALDAFVVYDSARSFVLVFVAGALVWVPWFRVDRRSRVYGLWFLGVSVLVLAIPLRFGGFSIWETLFRRVPGSSVIRDPKRVIEAYELAVVLVAGVLLARLPRASLLRRGIPLLLLTLIAAEWNREVFSYHRPNSVYAQMVKAPLVIDPSCRSFFVKGASQQYMLRSGHMWSLYAIDAMFIALNHGIPTLNGYSAWWPEDWELGNPQEPTYPGRVARWIDRHQLRNVCELDIEARTMTPYDPASSPR